MIAKVYPSAADLENLARVTTETSSSANAFDYSKVIVTKPWGHEYLWYQNASVAVWMLCIKAGHATSLHCHLRKRTSLIVLEGQVVCSTLEDRYNLTPLDGVVLEPCVFHTSEAICERGAYVIEIENPPLKGDLVRLKDRFGRAGTGYESARHHENVAAYPYHPFTPDAQYSFGGLQFALHPLQNRTQAQQVCDAAQLVVPILGRLVAGRNVLIEIGEAVRPCDLDLSILPLLFPPVELLAIESVAFSSFAFP